MIDFEKEIKDAVEKLTRDGTFRIIEMTYDEKNFGNILIRLKSNANFDIRFIRDRGDVWCELGLSKQTQEWFGINDILTIIGIQVVAFGKDLAEVINKTTDIMNQYFPNIDEAFNEKHFPDTRSKLKMLATKRMMRLFKNVKS